MNKSTGIIIGAMALVVIAGGAYAAMGGRDDSMMTKEKTEQQVMENKAMEKKDDAMVKEIAPNTDTMMKKDETSMMKVGSYEAYSADKIARAETGDVVLFFHASWCPSCRGLNSSIESNLKSIPEGVTILKADYDKETELKKKYGVTYQHTLVQVDKDGNMIKKWSGGGNLDSVLSQIQ